MLSSSRGTTEQVWGRETSLIFYLPVEPILRHVLAIWNSLVFDFSEPFDKMIILGNVSLKSHRCTEDGQEGRPEILLWSKYYIYRPLFNLPSQSVLECAQVVLHVLIIQKRGLPRVLAGRLSLYGRDCKTHLCLHHIWVWQFRWVLVNGVKQKCVISEVQW